MVIIIAPRKVYGFKNSHPTYPAYPLYYTSLFLLPRALRIAEPTVRAPTRAPKPTKPVFFVVDDSSSTSAPRIEITAGGGGVNVDHFSRFLGRGGPCRAVEHNAPDQVEEDHDGDDWPECSGRGIVHRGRNEYRTELLDQLKRHCPDNCRLKHRFPRHFFPRQEF